MNEYLTKETFYDIADVGSYDVNGTYKALFENWTYTGLDISAGPNVDKVVDPYNFGEKRYDVVVSGNCMEHVEDLHKWSEAIKKIIKPGGLLCIVTPWKIAEHRYPIDCWRVMPDGMKFLFKDLHIAECKIEDMDTYLIARTPS